MRKHFVATLLLMVSLFSGGCGDHHCPPENQQPERVVNSLSFPSTADDIQSETNQLLVKLDQQLTELLAVKVPTFYNFILPLNDLLYRYQTAYMRNNLLLSAAETAEVRDAAQLSNNRLGQWFGEVDESAWSASFSHLVGGYDATYYSYLWSDAIASDLISVFQDSPLGFYDPAIGKKLREEVFARGSSRDVNESIHQFLGRDWNVDAYLDSFTQ